MRRAGSNWLLQNNRPGGPEVDRLRYSVCHHHQHSLLGPGSGRYGAVGGPERRLLGLVVLLLLHLQGGHLLRLAQRVDGDGQEDVEQRVVAEQRQEDEVQRVDEAGASSALRLDALLERFT